MDWMWRRLAGHVRAKTQVEWIGISAEELAAALRQTAIRRLEYVEAIVFNEEIEEDQKIGLLEAWFLEEAP